MVFSATINSSIMNAVRLMLPAYREIRGMKQVLRGGLVLFSLFLIVSVAARAAEVVAPVDEAPAADTNLTERARLEIKLKDLTGQFQKMDAKRLELRNAMRDAAGKQLNGPDRSELDEDTVKLKDRIAVAEKELGAMHEELRQRLEAGDHHKAQQAIIDDLQKQNKALMMARTDLARQRYEVLKTIRDMDKVAAQQSTNAPPAKIDK